MIYQDDAVAFAYRAMMEESPKYPLYHITSGEAITQMDLAELIRQNADGVEVRDDTVGVKVSVLCWMAAGIRKSLTERFLSHMRRA